MWERSENGVLRERLDAEGYKRWDEDGDLVEQRALTPEEQAAVDAYVATQTATANEDALRQRAENALADLRTVAGSSGTLTGAQLSNAVRLLARVAAALIRLHLRRLEGTD